MISTSWSPARLWGPQRPGAARFNREFFSPARTRSPGLDGRAGAHLPVALHILRRPVASAPGHVPKSLWPERRRPQDTGAARGVVASAWLSVGLRRTGRDSPARLQEVTVGCTCTAANVSINGSVFSWQGLRLQLEALLAADRIYVQVLLHMPCKSSHRVRVLPCFRTWSGRSCTAQLGARSMHMAAGHV